MTRPKLKMSNVVFDFTLEELEKIYFTLNESVNENPELMEDIFLLNKIEKLIKNEKSGRIMERIRK